MTDILHIANHGPLVVSSTYWDTALAARGLLYLSINAGALRLLVPHSARQCISDMRPGARHVVLSILQRDRWPDKLRAPLAADMRTELLTLGDAPPYVAEWLVEDGTAEPWSCHLSAGQLDRIPGPDDVGKEWIATVWDRKDGRPHKCLERPAYVQIVPSLPWLRRIGA